MSNLENRVLVMERRLHEMQADLIAARNQFVPQNSPRRVRIAKVTQQPSSSGDKKFGVVFLNGDFTETMSPETASFTDRSNETYQKVAYNLGSKNPANGDRVFCFEVGERWWFRLEEGGTTSVVNDAVFYQSAPPGAYTKPVSPADIVVPIVAGTWPGTDPVGFSRGTGHTVVAEVAARVMVTSRVRYSSAVPVSISLRINVGSPTAYDVIDTAVLPATGAAYFTAMLSGSVRILPGQHFHLEGYAGASTFQANESTFSLLGIKE